MFRSRSCGNRHIDRLLMTFFINSCTTRAHTLSRPGPKLCTFHTKCVNPLSSVCATFYLSYGLEFPPNLLRVDVTGIALPPPFPSNSSFPPPLYLRLFHVFCGTNSILWWMTHFYLLNSYCCSSSPLQPFTRACMPPVSSGRPFLYQPPCLFHFVWK